MRYVLYTWYEPPAPELGDVAEAYDRDATGRPLTREAATGEGELITAGSDPAQYFAVLPAGQLQRLAELTPGPTPAIA